MSESSGLSFNLVSEPWLPVTLLNGSAETWGLREFFARAHEAKGLNEPSPLSYTATLRTLIAILHRAYTGPKSEFEWWARYEPGQFQIEEIERYLDRWQHRFDLYHPERPFAQVDADEEMAEGTTSPVARLVMERTSGNNPTLFDHSWDASPMLLSPGDAARAILTANQYAFAGSGGRFMQAPLVAGYCITLEGNSLFETLMFNLQQYDQKNPGTLTAEGDAPWWEFEVDPLLEKDGLRPRGLTDLLTWRSRKLRLLPESDGQVRWVQYAQRYVVADPDYRLRDPFKRYVVAESGTSKGKSFPKNFSPGRALWRDVDSLMEKADSGSTDEKDSNGRPVLIDWLANVAAYGGSVELPEPMIVATGLVNNQARIDLWRMDRLPLPIALLNDPELVGVVSRSIGLADRVRSSLRNAGTQFATTVLSKGERSPDPNDIARERAALQLDARYWSQLESRFQTFIHDLGDAEDPDVPLHKWTLALRDLARGVFVDATNEAGQSGRWLMAQAAGARTLASQFHRYIPEIREAEEALKEGVAA